MTMCPFALSRSDARQQGGIGHCRRRMVDELVQLAPDVIWLHSTPGAWAAKRATTTIPIVIGIAADLVEQGIVASLAQPGGNLTGLEQRSTELAGKRLELLKEALPMIARV